VRPSFGQWPTIGISAARKRARVLIGQIAAGADPTAEKRKDTQYFHILFTMPKEIAAIGFQNKLVIYDILFRAAAKTLRPIRRTSAPKSAT
jgi:Arm DNA-binding domain